MIALAREHPGLLETLAAQRPLLRRVDEGVEALEVALDAERRQLIHANEERLARYMAAAEPWAQIWPEVAREIDGKPLSEAQRIVCRRAQEPLPFRPKGDRDD